MYRPYIVFGFLGGFLGIVGLIPFARFFFYAFKDHSTSGHIQSLLAGSIFLIGAFICLALDIIADLIRINRALIEDNLEQTKRARFGSK
jgi:hypothetical protein